MVERKQKARRVVLSAFVLVAAMLADDTARAESDYRMVRRLDLTGRVGTATHWSAVVYESKAFNRALADGPLGGDQGAVFDRPARICFIGGSKPLEHCLETRTWKSDKYVAVEQTLQGLSTVTLASGPNTVRGVVLRTRCYADSEGENGTRIWRYVKRTDTFELISTISTGDVGEVKFFRDMSGRGFLVTSDYIWGNGEGRWDLHYFHISVYRFLPAGRYDPVLDYVTASRYPTLQGDEIVAHVVTPELSTIMAKVAAAHPKWASTGRRRADWLESSPSR